MIGEVYKVYWRGSHPKPKKVYFDGKFASRKTARRWCHNHQYQHEGFVIVHPDGTEEQWRWKEKL